MHYTILPRRDVFDGDDHCCMDDTDDVIGGGDMKGMFTYIDTNNFFGLLTHQTDI